ncbi:MAG TPA: PilZ domain-containing protein [Tepidisphaeraceae bacterium]|jgi:c-di-GMP-binding flagellar brake protein YcgR|nr:PilZ domain-containing protein [Tepidisphaeraceae bacterium]
MKLGIRDFADVIAVLKGPGGNISASEKRRAARIEVSAKINIHLFEGSKIARSFSALSRDISLTGIGLLQTVALNPNQSGVVIALPRQHSPLFVYCTVMQCRPLADGLLVVGLDFCELASKETADAILGDGKREHSRIQESILG